MPPAMLLSPQNTLPPTLYQIWKKSKVPPVTSGTRFGVRLPAHVIAFSSAWKRIFWVES